MTATCPTCSTPSSVKDSRPQGDTIRRRRVCAGCGARWSTVEIEAGVYAEMVRARRRALARFAAGQRAPLVSAAVQAGRGA